MTKLRLLPITELEAAGTIGMTQWDVRFPDYAPTSHIGINLSFLNRLTTLAGLTDISIQSASGRIPYDREEIEHINTDGTVVLHRARTLAREEVKAGITISPEVEAHPEDYDYYRPHGLIRLDLEAIEQDVLASRKGSSLRNPEAWSYQLNEGLVQGIRQTAHESLIVNESTKIKQRTMGMYAFSLYAGTMMAIEHNNPLYSMGLYASSYILNEGIHHIDMQRHQGKTIWEKKWSLTPRLNFDRMLGIQALTSLKNIIEPID